MNRISKRNGIALGVRPVLVLAAAAGTACDFPLATKDYRIEPQAAAENSSSPRISLIRGFAGDDDDCAEAVETSCSGTLARCESEPGCVDYSGCVRNISDPLATTKCQDQLGTSLDAQWAYEDLFRCWYLLDSKCDVGQDFRCVGNYDLPHSERTEFTLSERITYLYGEDMSPDFSLAVCPLATDCAEPSAVATPDGKGTYTVTVPWGNGLGGPGSAWNGYRLATSPNIYPSRIESNLPVSGTRITVTRVLSKDRLDFLALAYRAERREGIFVQVVDCQSAPAPGITVSLTNPAHGKVVHDGGGSVTIADGAVAIHDMKLDTVLDLVARHQGVGEVARHRITIPEGHLAYVRMYPQP